MKKDTVDTLSRPNGDKFALKDRGSWWAIIKTHQDGKSTQNKYGGYTSIHTGQEKYVKKKWAQMKKVKMRKHDTLGVWVHYEEKKPDKISFSDLRERLDEATKQTISTYDISKFDDEKLDELMDQLGRKSKTLQGKDWDIQEPKRGKLHLILFTKKADKAAQKFFGKKAKELIK